VDANRDLFDQRKALTTALHSMRFHVDALRSDLGDARGLIKQLVNVTLSDPRKSLRAALHCTRSGLKAWRSDLEALRSEQMALLECHESVVCRSNDLSTLLRFTHHRFSACLDLYSSMFDSRADSSFGRKIDAISDDSLLSDLSSPELASIDPISEYISLFRDQPTLLGPVHRAEAAARSIAATEQDMRVAIDSLQKEKAVTADLKAKLERMREARANEFALIRQEMERRLPQVGEIHRRELQALVDADAS
jgi:hypothetical protein